MSDKKMQRALATVAKRWPNLPEIQREIVAAVGVLRAENRIADMDAICESAGYGLTLAEKIVTDLLAAGVLVVSDAGGYGVSGAKPRAPKLEIVASAPVNILDPAFLNPGPEARGVVDTSIGPVVLPPDLTAAILDATADKGPDSGPVAQSMLATAAVPVDAGPDDESALIGWRKRLATLATEIDAVKGEIRTIRARMRAAGKVVPEGDKRDKAPAASRSERPETGRVLSATHKGIVHEVTVNATDFAYGGESYKSLSAIGRKITGWQTCDGGLFFGLRVKSNANATPRAPKSSNASPTAPVKPAPLGFGAAIAASRVASAPPAAVPAPGVTGDRETGPESPGPDASPASTPDADPFLQELETLGNVVTPAPAPKVATGKRGPRTFSASKNA